jgi:hypothetical protein
MLYDVFVVSDPQTNALYLQKGNGTFQDAMATAGLNLPANQPTGSGTFFVNSSGIWLRRSAGATETFIRIGHSLLALIAGWVGGKLSRRLFGVCTLPQPSAANDNVGYSRD